LCHRVVVKLSDNMFKQGHLKGDVAKMVATGSTGRSVMSLLLPEKIPCVVVNESPTPSPPEAILVPVAKRVNGNFWQVSGPWRPTFKRLQGVGGEFACACNPIYGWSHRWMLDSQKHHRHHGMMSLPSKL